MNAILARWNNLPPEEAMQEVLSCCGSSAWAAGIAAIRPFRDETSLLGASDETWSRFEPQDWLAAFKSHPRIGESRASAPAGEKSAVWSQSEQDGITSAQAEIKLALAEGNRAYEEKFGFIFIVCATGKSASEILAILQRRLQNGNDAELREAAEQQRQITQLRLKKWLGI